MALLAVAAALIATQLIDPDHYKGQLESAVRRETGRPLVLEGHPRLTWFPWLGVRTGPARIGAPVGTGGPDLLGWRSAEVRVRLLPLLLHRHIEVARVRIIGADIHLRRGPHGEGNWEDLIARLEPGSGAEGTPAAGKVAATPWSAAWAGLDFEQGSLDYRDERSRQHFGLQNWNLSVGPWRPGEPLSLRTSFVLHAGTPGNSASADGVLRLPAAGVRLSLDAPQLRISTAPLAVAAPRWSLRIADAKLDGALEAGSDGAGRLAASGSVQAAVPSLRELARTLGIAMPRTADPAALGALSLSGSWSCRDGSLEVRPLAARLDSTAITGWITWSRPPSPIAAAGASPPAPAWRFALRADQVDIGRYMTLSKARQPLELPVRALQALSAQGTLELEHARLGDTTLNDVRLEVH